MYILVNRQVQTLLPPPGLPRLFVSLPYPQRAPAFYRGPGFLFHKLPDIRDRQPCSSHIFPHVRIFVVFFYLGHFVSRKISLPVKIYLLQCIISSAYFQCLNARSGERSFSSIIRLSCWSMIRAPFCCKRIPYPRELLSSCGIPVHGRPVAASTTIPISIALRRTPLCMAEVPFYRSEESRQISPIIFIFRSTLSVPFYNKDPLSVHAVRNDFFISFALHIFIIFVHIT